jgi:hypothetical protein
MSRRLVTIAEYPAGRPKPGVDKTRRHLARAFDPFIIGRKDHTMTIVVTDWEARRSGASITLKGKDAAGNALKTTVSRIFKDGAKTIAAATDRGARYELA